MSLVSVNIILAFEKYLLPIAFRAPEAHRFVKVFWVLCDNAAPQAILGRKLFRIEDVCEGFVELAK